MNTNNISSSLNLNSSGGSSHSSSDQSTSSSWAKQLRERNNRRGSVSASASVDAAVVHVEVFDDCSQPSDKEIQEYAAKLGIDQEREPHLLNLAREGILQELPSEWRPCVDSESGEFYYFNFATGETQWEHPLDELYRLKVIEARLKQQQQQPAITTVHSEEPSSAAEVSSDVLSADMDNSGSLGRPPSKLAPLAPLGKAKLGSAGGSKKGLPPLTRSLPPAQTGMSPSAAASVPQQSLAVPEKVSGGGRTSPRNLSRESSPVPQRKQWGDAQPLSLGMSHVIRDKPLSMGMAGNNFLKSNKPMQQPSTQESSQVRPAATEDAPRGILRSRPPSATVTTKQRAPAPASSSGRNSDAELRAGAVAALRERDSRANKRIHFEDDGSEEEEEEEEEEPEFLSTEVEESEDSARPGPEVEKSQLVREPQMAPRDDNDFMARHSLFFDPEDLVVDEATLEGIIQDDLPQRDDKTPSTQEEDGESSQEESGGGGPKAKTRLSKILSNVVVVPKSGEESDERDTTLESAAMAVTRTPQDPNEDPNEVLGTVKFDSGVMRRVESSRRGIIRREGEGAPRGEMVKDQLGKVGEPLTKQRDFESEKQREVDELRRFREEMTRSVDEQREGARREFENEVRKAKEAMARSLGAEVEAEKMRLTREFEAEMTRAEKREAEMERRVRNEVESYYGERMRRELDEQKARLEDQRARLEAELREQFRRDIAALRDEMAEVNRKTSPPPPTPAPPPPTVVKRRDSGEMVRQMEVMKDALKADFEEQIKTLMGEMRLIENKEAQTRRKALRQEPDFDEDGIEIVQQEVGMENHGTNGQIPKSKSTTANDDAGHADALDKDLTRSLQSLQQRVVSLERSLAPFATPFQVPSVAASTRTRPFMEPGSAAILQSAADQYIAATATNMNFSRFSTSTAVATNGGWSVEEQLYKSKMWLKQRNQSMLSKPP